MLSSKAVCGFDFGTSNTSVAVKNSVGEVVCYSFPSAIFFEFETKSTLFGDEALTSYYDLIPGRLFTSFKSLLGKKIYNSSTMIHGQLIPFEEIITSYISFIKETVEKDIGYSLTAVLAGRPVFFIDQDPVADAKAQADLKSIFQRTGFELVEFELEPIAATYSFLSHHTEENTTILTVDIGGGTSDFCLFNSDDFSAGKKLPIETVGVHLGGDDFDKDFSMCSVMPLLGRGSKLKRNPSITIPNHFFYDMSCWRSIYEQYKFKNINDIKQIALQVEDNTALERLIKVLNQRLGHNVLKQVQNAKVTLSSVENTIIDLDFVENNLELQVSQADLNNALSKILEKISASIDSLLSTLAVDPEQIDYIVCTGGSTLVPALKNLLYQKFDRKKIIQHDTFNAVAKGLMLRAAEILPAQ